MWFSSSAGVSTSLSSMKSTSSACSTSASAKCPMRTLAITGIVTVSMISRMTLMDAIRATPPSLRMSEGTRSRAITAQAPAFSAILACSAFVTSIITPPLSISARPTFTRHSFAVFPTFALPWPFPLPFIFFVSISFSLEPEKSQSRTPGGNHGLSNYHEPPTPARQQIPVSIVNLADAKPASSLLVLLPAAHNDLRIGWHRLAVFDAQLRGDGSFFRQFGNLAHHFIQQHGNHAAVDEARSARIARPENKFPTRSPRTSIDLERQLHPKTVGAAATKTIVRRIRCQNQFFSHFHLNSGFRWVSKSSL